MKITLCGSIAFFKEMLEIKRKLEDLGHEIRMPISETENDKGEIIPIQEYYKIRKTSNDNETWVWDKKEQAMRIHFDKVVWSDAVLVLNYDKNNIKDYIGANTFLEMGLAMHLKKKIYLLNSIPNISYKEELLGMKPVILRGNLNKIV